MAVFAMQRDKNPIHPSPDAVFKVSLIVMTVFCMQGLSNRAVAQPPGGKRSPETLFEREVAPLLIKRCLACHGGKTTEGGYSIQSVGSLRTAGDSELAPVVKGAPDQSELYRRLISTDNDLRMPLDAPPLSAKEIAVIKQWIDQGAETSGDPKQSLSTWAALREETSSAPKHYPHRMPISAMAMSPDGTRLYAAGYHEVTVWDTAQGSLIDRIANVPHQITDVEISSDGYWLAIAGGIAGIQGEVQLRDLNGAVPSRTLLSTKDTPTDIAFSFDGTYLAVGQTDGSLRVLETVSGETRYALTPHADALLAIAWGEDAKHWITASRDRTGKLFDAERGELVASYDRHERAVGGVGLLKQGALTLDETGQLRLWNLQRDDQLTERGGFRRYLQRFVTWRDQIFIPNADGIERLEIETREIDQGKDENGKEKKKKTTYRLKSLEGFKLTSPGWIVSISVSVNGTLAVGTDQGLVQMWHLETNQPLNTFSALPKKVSGTVLAE